MDYQQIVFPYKRSADLGARTPPRHPVVVVGAGPVGLYFELRRNGDPVDPGVWLKR